MCAMKRLILIAVSFITWAMVPGGHANTAAAVPELPFESVPDPLTLPPDIHFGEIAGVAINSKGHIFVFSRGNSTGPAYMATAAQLLEFDRERQVRSRDRQEQLRLGLRACGAHRQAGQHLDRRQRVEHDPEDESARPRGLGVRTQGRVVSPRRAARLRVADERPSRARRRRRSRGRRTTTRATRCRCIATTCSTSRPTWRGTRKGNSYFTDGYVNSRVAKANAKGEWVASWGSLGNGQVQFDTPHGIAVVAEGRDLCRRSRQPPHPGARYERQVPPRIHHRRARRYQARQDRLRRRNAECARPDRRRPVRPTRSA